MQYERLMSLSNGTCIKIDNSLTYRVKSIFFELEKNKKYEDHISVSNARELLMDGMVYSDNNRVVIKNPIISDKSIDVTFNIDTMDLEDGDVIKGNISFVTNVGTANIPFEYTIITNTTIRTIKGLNSITDFYDYLCDNFESARALFNDKEFVNAPMLRDDFAMSLYEGLIKGSNKDIELIEFFKAFEIDISRFYENVDDDIVKPYIDDALDSIDLNKIKNNDKFSTVLSLNNDIETSNDKVDIYYEEAKKITDSIEDKELLTVLASMCVRSGFVDELSFKIYLKVIERGSNINGIYDRFLMSIPEDYGNKLPLYIYRYYFDEKNYSFDDKIKLYENIIASFNESDNVYKMYSNEILEYAISRIYQNRITESLIKIYNKVLSVNIINESNYNNVLYLLRNHKIIISDKSIKKVIIKYIETEKETKYDVINGIAYVPIFFESRIILYEDQYGNRFFNENAEIKILFNRKDLESYIIENYPQKDIIDMTKIIKLNETENLTKDYEIDEIRDLEKKISINKVIIDKFEKKIIDFYFRKVVAKESLSDDAQNYLLKLNFNRLLLFEKRKMLKIMLECNEYRFVYDKISYYGQNLMEDEDLLRLFSKCIDMNYEGLKNKLCIDIFNYVKNGNRDQKLCYYLANNYEGSIDNMLLIMNAMNESNLDSSYIAKKLLMFSLESNDIRYIDHIFDFVDVNDDSNKNLLVAYLNKKSTDYVLDNVEMGKDFFDKLKRYLIENYDNINTMPIIFLFAITKYISSFKLLSDNDLRRILIKSMERLLKTDYVFAYYKKLNRHMRMPYYIMNKEYIEYHADKDFVPRVTISISGEDEKKTLDLNKVFMNIYVKKITVFKNEIVNYEITNTSDESMGVLEKGTLTYDENYEIEYPKNRNMRGTYDYINDAIVCLDRDNIEGLKKVVMEMVEKQAMSKELFNI